MKLRILFLHTLVLLVFCGMSPSTWAQTSFFEESNFNVESDFMTGFSEDGRIKILMLTLVPSGMTETAAQEIGKALQLNLFNTNHFTVVGPSEWNAQIRSKDPSLGDCHDISCGILIGKLFNADKVLVGQISAEKILNDNAQEVDGVVMTLRLVDVITNTATFSDSTQFTDRTMHDALFTLATQISETTLLKGHILSVDREKIKIDLGRAHGLKEGDQMVIFSQSPTISLEGQTIGLEQKNIGIVQLHRLNDMSSEALVKQKIDPIDTRSFVKTYVNFSKQIRLIAQTRRELDTQKRLQPKVRLSTVQPQIVDEATGEKKWQNKLLLAQYNETVSLMTTLGLGALTLYSLNTDINLSLLGDQSKSIIPLLLAAGTAYSGYQYIQYRSLANEILAEGRVRGFILPTEKKTSQVQWITNGNTIAMRYQF